MVFQNISTDTHSFSICHLYVQAWGSWWCFSLEDASSGGAAALPVTWNGQRGGKGPARGQAAGQGQSCEPNLAGS